MQVLLYLLDAIQLLQLMVRELRGDNKDKRSQVKLLNTEETVLYRDWSGMPPSVSFVAATNQEPSAYTFQLTNHQGFPEGGVSTSWPEVR